MLASAGCVGRRVLVSGLAIGEVGGQRQESRTPYFYCFFVRRVLPRSFHKNENFWSKEVNGPL